MNKQVTTGSVYDDPGLDPGKAEQMKIKAALFDAIVAYIKENDLTRIKSYSVCTSKQQCNKAQDFHIITNCRSVYDCPR